MSTPETAAASEVAEAIAYLRAIHRGTTSRERRVEVLVAEIERLRERLAAIVSGAAPGTTAEPAHEPPACDDCGEHHEGYGDCPAAGATAPETTPPSEKPVDLMQALLVSFEVACATCRGRGEVWCPYEWVVCGSCGGSGVVET